MGSKWKEWTKSRENSGAEYPFVYIYKRILSDQKEEVPQVLNSVGEDLVPAVVKKPKLATTSSMIQVFYPSLLALIIQCTNVKIEFQK